MAESTFNSIALLVTGFATGTILGTTVVLELGDYLPTGFPFSETERLQWETLLAGLAALLGEYLAYRSAIYPLRHRQKQKSIKLAMQMSAQYSDAFGMYISFLRNNPNKEEVEIILAKTRTHITNSVGHLLDYTQNLDLDTDIYSAKAEKYREVMTYALSDVLAAEDTERYLRKLKTAENTCRQFINLFSPEKIELMEPNKNGAE